MHVYRDATVLTTEYAVFHNQNLWRQLDCLTFHWVDPGSWCAEGSHITADYPSLQQFQLVFMLIFIPIQEIFCPERIRKNLV